MYGNDVFYMKYLLKDLDTKSQHKKVCCNSRMMWQSNRHRFFLSAPQRYQVSGGRTTLGPHQLFGEAMQELSPASCESSFPCQSRQVSALQQCRNNHESHLLMVLLVGHCLMPCAELFKRSWMRGLSYIKHQQVQQTGPSTRAQPSSKRLRIWIFMDIPSYSLRTQLAS